CPGSPRAIRGAGFVGGPGVAASVLVTAERFIQGPICTQVGPFLLTPSPLGRRWPNGPDEGTSSLVPPALRAPSPQPSPVGRRAYVTFGREEFWRLARRSLNPARSRIADGTDRRILRSRNAGSAFRDARL